MSVAYAKPIDCVDIVPALAETNDQSILMETSLAQSLLDASRLFESDLFAPVDFFAQAGEDFTTKKFFGNGTSFVRLAPYTEFENVKDFDDVLIDAEDYQLYTPDTYYPRGYYLRWLAWNCGTLTWWKTNPIKVSAKWGFPCVPPDVKVAVKNMGCLMFLVNPQNQVGQNAGLTDNQESRLRNTYNRIMQSWQDKFHHLNIGIS